MNVSQNRLQAIDQDQPTYKGRPCRRCGSEEKYVSNYACVRCSQTFSSARNKQRWQRIKAEGLSKEIGEKYAHHRKRYYETHKDRICATVMEQKCDLGEYYLKRALTAVKSKSKRKGIPFSITASDLSMPTHCPILGIELQYNAGGAADNSPSLDRIIPNLGYVPGNVIIISSRANRIKNNATVEELRLICEFYAHVVESEFK